MDSEPLYDPVTILLDTSLGYYLSKARNVLVAHTGMKRSGCSI